MNLEQRIEIANKILIGELLTSNEKKLSQKIKNNWYCQLKKLVLEIRNKSYVNSHQHRSSRVEVYKYINLIVQTEEIDKILADPIIREWLESEVIYYQNIINYEYSRFRFLDRLEEFDLDEIPKLLRKADLGLKFLDFPKTKKTLEIIDSIIKKAISTATAEFLQKEIRIGLIKIKNNFL